MKISAIMLAAGLSRRMGEEDKLLLDYKGKPLIQHAVDLLCRLPCEEKILVTTQPRLFKVFLPQPQEILTVVNSRPEAGQSESLRLGLLESTGDHYLFLNADQPRLSLDSLRLLLEFAQKNQDKIIYPSINGNPCSPALFPARFRLQLMELTGDTGGRTLRAAYPEDCLSFEAGNPDEFVDIDCLEDYWALRG